MDGNPLTPQKLKLHRDRILSEFQTRRIDRRGLAGPEELEKLFNKAAFVANKANHLARAIEEPSRRLFIPVHPSAIEVVAAVKRKSADSPDGSEISFDLFKDAVEAMQRFRKEGEPLVKLSQGIEPASVLTKRVRKLRSRINLNLSASSKYDSDEEDDVLEMLVSQFMIIWVAHELMKPWEGLDHLEFLSTVEDKQEGAPEITVLVHIVIGIIIQLIIMGLNDELMEKYLEQSATLTLPRGRTWKDLIAEAHTLERTRAQELAELQAAQNDYHIILEYSRDYIRAHLHDGFEMWVAYIDVVQHRYTAQSLWVHAPHYSIPHALYAQNFESPKGRRRLRRAVQERIDEEQERREDAANTAFTSLILDTIVPMASTAQVVRNDALDGINDDLNLVAQVIHSDFAMEVACCFGVAIGSFPTESLESIRAFLNGLLRAYSYDLKNALTRLFSVLSSPSFVDYLAMEAQMEIDKIFHDLMQDAIGIFGEDWESLICCPLVGEMIQQVIKSIARLESEAHNAIDIMAARLRYDQFGSTSGFQARYSDVQDMRILRKMILIIDGVLAAGEIMEACDPDRPQTNFNSRLVRDTGLHTITVESDIKNNYFLDAIPRQLESGKFLPALGEEMTTLVVDPIQRTADRIAGKHSCMGGSKEDLSRAQISLGGD